MRRTQTLIQSILVPFYGPGIEFAHSCYDTSTTINCFSSNNEQLVYLANKSFKETLKETFIEAFKGVFKVLYFYQEFFTTQCNKIYRRKTS
jgi:hypothetical protein